jgi:UDP-N-acetylglucosamine--N-acetylmuramyl-(pentapeptide) pyrophosphoryl-undecaprenol N-acetylglucosamine transferase
MHRHSTYIFAGGGTGGHLFPGIAVAEELQRRNASARMLFVGSERSIEKTIIDEYSYEHHRLTIEPLRTLTRNPTKFLWRNQQAYRTAKRLLQHSNPEAVIGLGGFASVPVVLAASSLRIPVILLEQNIVPGRATRWLSSRASLVCVSYSETCSEFSSNVAICLTGNPIRAEICDLCNRPVESCTQTQPTLLILGGSQGAQALNDAVVSAVVKNRELLTDWKIVHQTGSQQIEPIRQTYAQSNLDTEVQPFFSNLSEWYGRATLVISRAGATTLAELSCSGTPAILIPYPNSVRDHQLLNAQAYQAAGAARIVEQCSNPAVTAENLFTNMAELINNEKARRQMQQAMRTLATPNAAANVVNQLETVTAQRKVA